MKAILLMSLLWTAACQDTNSNSFDREKFTERAMPEGARPEFTAALAILQNRCMSCHFGFHNAWNAFTTEEQWLEAGLINRGDPDNSLLIKRMKNAAGPGATMPIAAAAIPDAEFQTLKAWIAGFP